MNSLGLNFSPHLRPTKNRKTASGWTSVGVGEVLLSQEESSRSWQEIITFWQSVAYRTVLWAKGFPSSHAGAIPTIKRQRVCEEVGKPFVFPKDSPSA